MTEYIKKPPLLKNQPAHLLRLQQRDTISAGRLNIPMRLTDMKSRQLPIHMCINRIFSLPVQLWIAEMKQVITMMQVTLHGYQVFTVTQPAVTVILTAFPAETEVWFRFRQQLSRVNRLALKEPNYTPSSRTGSVHQPPIIVLMIGLIQVRAHISRERLLYI